MTDAPKPPITAVTKPKQEQRFDILDNPTMHKLGLGVARTEGIKVGEKIQLMLWRAMHSDVWEDGDYMDDVRQATLRGAHPVAELFFWASIAFVVIFLVWASFSRIDEVSRGQGIVIPSGKIQAVGSPEGGVVSEIMVRSGDIVSPGQVLVRLDDTTAASGVGEKENRRAFLTAQIAMYEAVLSPSIAFNLDPSFTATYPTIAAEAEQLYKTKSQEIQSTGGVLAEQLEGKKQELADARRTANSTGQALALAKKEFDMAKPYLASGAISQVDLLKVERQYVDAQKEHNTALLAVPTAEAAYREAENRLSEGTLKATNEARDELAKAKEEFGRLGETVKADIGKVERALLRSPIHAEVKQVLVNTVGQAVQPNTNIVELVPLEETLLIEAQVKPQDIAFIRPGLEASVKVTAYDFSIYGGLKGVVESISADSFEEKKDGKQETFYKIQVRTDRNYLERGKEKLPIKSGMVATVDVLTGKKTIMQYLLKPINKARDAALTER